MPLTSVQHSTIMNQVNEWIIKDTKGFSWGIPQSGNWSSLGGPNMNRAKAVYVRSARQRNPIDWHISINLPMNTSRTTYTRTLNQKYGKIAHFAIDYKTTVSRVNITLTQYGLTNLKQSLKILESDIRRSLKLRYKGPKDMVFGSYPKR